jgi:tetratricopeptide (TPR) repeat protein
MMKSEQERGRPGAQTGRLNRRRLGAAIALAIGLGLAGLVALRGVPAPSSAEDLRRRASVAARQGRWGDVRQALDALAARWDLTAADRLLQAEALNEAGKPDAAIGVLHAIPDDRPEAARARLRAGQIELRRDRMRFAETDLLAALRLDPKLIQARRELVYVYGMQTRRRELAAQLEALSKLVPLTFDQAFLWCLTRGSVWDAIEQSETLRRFLDADPEDRWSRLALSDSLANLGQLDEAESVLEPLSEDDPEAIAARARLAIDRGDLERADRLLAHESADTPELSRLRGRMALLRRDAEAAVRHYRAANDAEPYDRATVYGLAQALRLRGDDAGADRFTAQAKALDHLATLVQYAAGKEGRDDPALPFKLGQACEAVGRLPEARAWYQIAIDRNPTDAAAQKALFRVNREMGED